MCDYRKTLERFNTQPPEGGCHLLCRTVYPNHCFNTQPPEGGCPTVFTDAKAALVFQHTAARRRLLLAFALTILGFLVSTHSRPKAAAAYYFCNHCRISVSTHSRPKAAAIMY